MFTVCSNEYVPDSVMGCQWHGIYKWLTTCVLRVLGLSRGDVPSRGLPTTLHGVTTHKTSTWNM